MFAHGQLHILNVIFRLTAVCEIAMSNKKDKLNTECVFFVRKLSKTSTVDGDDGERGESAV